MSLMAASPIPLPLERGAFCVSIDVERLWGVWDVLTERDRRHASLEGPILEELVQLLDEYGVPATFALVGRLLDDSPGFDGLTGPASHWHAP
ncbi:MAG: hypothetical protein OEY14_11695, partial [Myxococcales bacterium]|nr:hypothetical protein [Myxococcales bacterium]